MAKKAKNKNQNQASDQKMVDKVNQKMATNDNSKLSRAVGIGLIVFGAVLVVLALVLVALSYRNPKVDDSIPVPTIEAEQYTKDDTAKVNGSTEDNGRVIFYVDDKKYDASAKADDKGQYEAEITLDDEGEYKVEAAAVKGFPLRRQSEKSKAVTIIVDRTAPSSNATLDYDPVSETGKVDLKGKTEAGATVKLDGKKDYTATANENGEFEIKGITLEKGENEFKVTLTDKAGNVRTLSRTVMVENVVPDSADLDGDGIADNIDNPELPEAAGELDAAFAALTANKVMTTFGLIALLVVLGNTAIVVKKMRS